MANYATVCYTLGNTYTYTYAYTSGMPENQSVNRALNSLM